MTMDEQPLQLRRWSTQLQRGEELTLIPSEDEPFVVTEVFLVDPESAAGQGVVSAYVEMGTQKIMLAELSSEVKAVELESALVLEEEFRVYVMQLGGDSNADTDMDEDDAVVVQFKGFMVSLPWYSDTDTDEEEEEEEDAGSENGETDHKDEKSDGEVDRDVATERSNAKDIDSSALRTLLGLFLFTFMILAFCI
jgi:hypothetical protein